MNEIRITRELAGGSDVAAYGLAPGAGLLSEVELGGGRRRGEWAAARPGPSAATLRAKRAVDVVLAALLLVGCLPVMLLIALAVRIEGGGPVLIAHERVGRFGRPFRCLKFRSMVADADAALARLLAGDPAARAEWAARRKLRRDPRVTRVGRALRASSLDELPQLLNVLRGEMSLVGPRPVPREELEEHYGEEGRACYLSIRPGLTGPWQVSGRSDTSYARRVSLDIDYVVRLSLLRDFGILLRTVRAILARSGAY